LFDLRTDQPLNRKERKGQRKGRKERRGISVSNRS
jgi:hypothetical protein